MTSLLTMIDMKLVIDTRSQVPAYEQLADQLQAAVEAGEIARGQALPSITALVQETGLAVGTVRHALQVLAEENVVTIVPGRGTFAR